ncbi:RNA-binding protein pop5 [Microbotryomycetes sp. JL201]|nr:RNA-binding protein pop5 [Microbotryomycetes sp. JL201]
MVRFKHRYLLVELLFPGVIEYEHDIELARRGQQHDATLVSNDNPSVSAATPPDGVGFLNESALMQTLRDSLAANFGDIGAGEVGGTFSIKYFSQQTHTAIIRVSRQHFRTLWAALTLLRALHGQPVIARVVHVGGTIRKTQHAAIALDRQKILKHAARTRMTDKQIIETRLLESEKGLQAVDA